MLQRIYGTAFWRREELDDYLERLEEAKKRDHRRLGVDLDLFSVDEELGAGLYYWHPKGAQLRLQVEVVKLRSRTCKMRGRAEVDGELAAEAEILSALVDRDG